MSRTNSAKLYARIETAYGVDPDGTGDGVSYLWVPTENMGEIEDGKAPIPQNFSTGREGKSQYVEGPDGWSLSFDVPVIGLNAYADHSTTPAAVGWYDALLSNMFGTKDNLVGNNLASATATTMTVDAGDPFSAYDMVATWEAGVGGRAYVNHVTVNSNPIYTVSPGTNSSYTSAADAFGMCIYRRIVGVGGSSIAFIRITDDDEYLCLGGRVTAASFKGEVGGRWMMSLTYSGDTVTRSATGVFGSVPAAGSAPDVTPCKVLLSPFAYGTTTVETSSIEIDLGIDAQPIMSTQAANGRSDYTLINMDPSVTVTPLYTDGLNELKRSCETAANQTQVMVQMGSGEGAPVATPTMLNVCGFMMTNTQVTEVSRTDDNNTLRGSLKFECIDPGSTTGIQRFQFARG